MTVEVRIWVITSVVVIVAWIILSLTIIGLSRWLESGRIDLVIPANDPARKCP